MRSVVLLLLALLLLAACGGSGQTGIGERGALVDGIAMVRGPLGEVRPFFRESLASGDGVSEGSPASEHLVRTARLACGHILVLVDDPSWSTVGLVALEVAPSADGWKLRGCRLGVRSCVVGDEPWAAITSGRIEIATDNPPGVLSATLSLVAAADDLRVEAAFSCEPAGAAEQAGSEEWLADLVDQFHPPAAGGTRDAAGATQGG